jgi:hypothetical protein
MIKTNGFLSTRSTRPAIALQRGLVNEKRLCKYHARSDKNIKLCYSKSDDCCTNFRSEPHYANKAAPIHPQRGTLCTFPFMHVCETILFTFQKLDYVPHWWQQISDFILALSREIGANCSVREPRRLLFKLRISQLFSVSHARWKAHVALLECVAGRELLALQWLIIACVWAERIKIQETSLGADYLERRLATAISRWNRRWLLVSFLDQQK